MYIRCHFYYHMDWINQHSSFQVEMFIKKESVTAVPREFLVLFGFGRYDPVATQNKILFGVTNFRAPGLALR